MRQLDENYSAEIDNISEPAWYGLLRGFDDASIYQTWAYGEVRNGRKNISHLVLRKQGRVVAVAQARIKLVPLIPAGIAYVMWGPLWCPNGTRPNTEVFRQVLRALHNEYACKRGLVLRVYPRIVEEESHGVTSLFEEEGFVRVGEAGRSMTLVMDLDRSIEELRRGLRSHWQRELKVAEKQKMGIVEGQSDELMGRFIAIYKEMVARKQFREPNDIEEFRAIQQRLPEPFQMKIMLCGHGEADYAGSICSAIGGTALYLFGATSNTGMKSRGSYLLQWKLLEWLRQGGVAQYDLNGINAETNPGTYKFKTDMAGEKGREVRFLGQFDACESIVSRVCVYAAETVKAALRGAR